PSSKKRGTPSRGKAVALVIPYARTCRGAISGVEGTLALDVDRRAERGRTRGAMTLGAMKVTSGARTTAVPGLDRVCINIGGATLNGICTGVNRDAFASTRGACTTQS
ncbi:MAG: hypothetical protein ACKPKO_00755, partial [Candidatus Fonsibacter sp.]